MVRQIKDKIICYAVDYMSSPAGRKYPKTFKKKDIICRQAGESFLLFFEVIGVDSHQWMEIRESSGFQE